jgi:membrane protease YdiL (CAAX protease family)
MFISKYLLGVEVQDMTHILSKSNVSSREMLALKLFQVFASIGGFLVPAFLFSKAINQKAITFLQINKPSKTYTYFMAIGLIILASPLVAWLYQINQHLTFPEQFAQLEANIRAMENQAEQLTKAFIKVSSVADLMFNVFVIALLPAITEEIFFRACLQNFARLCFQNIHISVWFAAIMFSAFHGQFYGFLPRLILGAMLGYIFLWSGGLWVSILAHLANNALAIFIFHYKGMSLEATEGDFQNDWTYYGLSLAMFGGIMFALIKKRIPQSGWLIES